MDKHTTAETLPTTTAPDVTPTGAACAHRSNSVVCGDCQLDRWRTMADALRPETLSDGAEDDGDGVFVSSEGAVARTDTMEGYVTVDVDSTDPLEPASASICLEPLAAVTLARQLLDMAAAAIGEGARSSLD